MAPKIAKFVLAPADDAPPDATTYVMAWISRYTYAYEILERLSRRPAPCLDAIDALFGRGLRDDAWVAASYNTMTLRVWIDTATSRRIEQTLSAGGGWCDDLPRGLQMMLGPDPDEIVH